MREWAKETENAAELDRLLVIRVKNRDEQAFGQLVQRYQKQVFKFAYGFFQNRDDALEIVQETFLRVYEKIDLFREGRSIQGWILRLAHNLCIDYYRKFKKRHPVGGLDQIPESQFLPPWVDGPQMDFSEFSRIMAEALHCLSPHQRAVFVMKQQQGMTVAEVARNLGVATGTVKTLHHRAIKKIKRQVGAFFKGAHG